MPVSRSHKRGARKGFPKFFPAQLVFYDLTFFSLNCRTQHIRFLLRKQTSIGTRRAGFQPQLTLLKYF